MEGERKIGREYSQDLGRDYEQLRGTVCGRNKLRGRKIRREYEQDVAIVGGEYEQNTGRITRIMGTEIR